MIKSNKKFIFCETPPLEYKGFGFSVLLFHLFNKNNNVEKFFTFKYYKEVNKPDFNYNDYPIILLDRIIPNWLYKIIPNRILEVVREFFFYISLFRLIKEFNSKPNFPILFCIGSNSKPVFYSYIFYKFIKNPIQLYIVDDFELLTNKNSFSISNRFGLYVFPKIIKNCQKIFVISKGLEQKYFNKYSINTEIIYPSFLPIRNIKIDYKTNNEFHFVFSGGLSRIYNSTLLIFANSLIKLNSIQNQFNYKLIIQTYTQFDEYKKIGFPESVTQYTTSKERNSNIDSYCKSDCFLIPYSFREDEKNIVSTSFPQKIAELIQLSRPLLYFGPDFGSVSIFFKENNLNFLLNSTLESDIINEILKISKNEDKNYIKLYETVYEKYFNPNIKIL